MEFKNFAQLIAKVKSGKSLKKVAVVAAEDEHTLEAVFQAVADKLVEPVLIGNEEKIKAILAKHNIKGYDNAIIAVEDEKAAAAKGCELINAGKADFIMKGIIQTADLLGAVVDKEKGLRTGRVMSHFAIHELPSYHKLLVVTDGGMVTYPDIEKKRQIVQNAVDVMVAMGYEKPKVAVLAAVEKVNPNMPESVDGAELKAMSQDGRLTNCIVEGPISYDCAMNKESAKTKGYSSPVTGEPDILVVPNITAGNIMAKALVFSAGAKMAGFIVGAKVPIVVTSRGATSEEKYLSLVLCAASV